LPFPLKPEPTKAFLNNNDSTETEKDECPGSTEEPKATPGVLCLYVFVSNNPTKTEPELLQAFPVNFGALLIFDEDEEVTGSWAIEAD
jgi:hypothetical protein